MGYLTHRPAAGNITEAFGPRPKPTPISPPLHYGLDFGWGGGDSIYAARSGYVKSYARVGSYGNRLVIDHGGGRETWYCHLTGLAPGVGVGDYVQGGRWVAIMGNTGNVTAKHLHFELRVDGNAVDPAPYLITTSSTDMEDIDMSAVTDDLRAAQWFTEPKEDAVIAGPGWGTETREVFDQRMALGQRNIERKIDTLLVGGANIENKVNVVNANVAAILREGGREAIAGAVQTLPPDVLGALAVACADESDRRQRERLAQAATPS